MEESKPSPRKRGQKIAAGEIDRLIGMRIRIARNMFHKRQEDLASFLGFTLQQTQKYENGKNKVSVHLLTKVAEFFRIPISYFIPTNLGSVEDNTIDMMNMITPFKNVAEDWKPIGTNKVNAVKNENFVAQSAFDIRRDTKDSLLLEFVETFAKIDFAKQKEFVKILKQYSKDKK